MKYLVVIVLAVHALLRTAAGDAIAQSSFTLEAVREDVKRDYKAVDHISTDALALALSQDKDFLLLDVREKGEFAVSRLPGAIQVDPDVWTSSFVRRFADKVKDRTVVLYCSVGVRSSRLAQRVQNALMERGATRVYNLDGGIFAWHNEARSLTTDKGPTRYVHPYDSHWGKLVERSDLVRTRP